MERLEHTIKKFLFCLFFSLFLFSLCFSLYLSHSPLPLSPSVFLPSNFFFLFSSISVCLSVSISLHVSLSKSFSFCLLPLSYFALSISQSHSIILSMSLSTPSFFRSISQYLPCSPFAALSRLPVSISLILSTSFSLCIYLCF